MLDLLLLNTRVHLKFFARNRLLLALALVVTVGFALLQVPAFFMLTTISRFDLLRSTVSQLGSMTVLITSSLGLFAVTWHLRSRSLKMVLTKPCPPEVWLGSIFLAGGIVTAGIHLAMALTVAVFSFAWGVPYQTGFAFIAIDGFLRAMIWFSYLAALSVAVHPVVAVLAALVVNEGTLYQLKFMIAASLEAQGPNWLLTTAATLADAAYMVLPMLHPMSDKTGEIYSSLRTTGADWWLLVEIAAYTALVTSFFYCLADLLIRRRSLA